LALRAATERGFVDRRSVALFGIGVCILIAGMRDPQTAAAEPLDLRDPSPRSIHVEFEVSPSHLPHQTDRIYTTSYPAQVEPGATAGEVRVIVPGWVVEQHLFARENPVPGSFSDFVWTFDALSGHVLSARFSGDVVRSLEFGFIRSRARVALKVDMATNQLAGFRSATRLLGQLLFKHCSDQAERGCTLVDARPYDASTGYVNAVGSMHVRSAVTSLVNFSPLGEAIFSEVEGSSAPGLGQDREQDEALRAALDSMDSPIVEGALAGGEAFN
jgi:hypothetical protein